MPTATSSPAKVITATLLGNLVEWYGFILVIVFASTLKENFFPKTGLWSPEVFVIMMFVAGFVFRPIGGLIYGHMGDKGNRINPLSWSILFQAIPSILIALLPSYNYFGVVSATLLIIFRLLQGLSTGGEFPGSISYIVEFSPNKLRGFYGALPFAGAFAGMVLGSISYQVLHLLFTDTQITTWAWRLPFLFIIIPSILGFQLRRQLSENTFFRHAKDSAPKISQPIKYSLLHNLSNLSLGFFITGIAACTVYLVLEFMPHHLQHIRPYTWLLLLVPSVFTPISGLLSDKLGRKPVMICGCIGIIIFIYPMMRLLELQTLWGIIYSSIFLGIIVSMFMGPLCAKLVELYPTTSRYSSISISYNFSYIIFGGLAPIITAAFLRHHYSINVIAIYEIIIAVISLIAIFFLVETHRRPLA